MLKKGDESLGTFRNLNLMRRKPLIDEIIKESSY